jgi:putative oxidoreductase
MKRVILNQQAIWSNSIFLLRCWVGIIFIRCGLSIWHQSNMQDFADTLQTVNIPFPLLSAWLCKTTEVFGGIFLVLGFLKRPACLLLVIDMTVATFVFHKGLIMQKGMMTFLLLICCLTILLSPSDKLSIDWLFYKKKKNQT